MSNKTITIKNHLEDGYLGVARDCHLCGETFVIGLQDYDTICPKCKELWKLIVKEKRNE